MSRPLNTALAAAGLVTVALLLGGWAGYHAAQAVPVAPLPGGAKSPAEVNLGPVIRLPPPIDLSSPVASVVPLAPMSTASQVVPGGVVSGQSVGRMWETTSNLAWQVRSDPLTPPNWYITGVVKRGQQTQVIVQFDGETQLRFLKIGDVLPGGGKLAWVRPDAIGVVTPQRKRLEMPVLSGVAESAAAAQGAPTQSRPRTAP